MLRKTRLYLWRNGISPLALLFVVALIGLSVASRTTLTGFPSWAPLSLWALE
jgi:hypothetical protein